MSKDNVALFVRMVAEKPNLNKRASAERNTRRWVELGNELGLEFNEDDLVGFVKEMINKDVTADNAVLEFTRAMTDDGELSDDQLDAVSGGARGAASSSASSMSFTPGLNSALVRGGYSSPGGDVAQFVEFPDDPAKWQQSGTTRGQ